SPRSWETAATKARRRRGSDRGRRSRLIVSGSLMIKL
ncbi:hypothetical protein LINPERHAP2_LOCUS22893, partial [Linum perenne]